MLRKSIILASLLTVEPYAVSCAMAAGSMAGAGGFFDFILLMFVIHGALPFLATYIFASRSNCSFSRGVLSFLGFAGISLVALVLGGAMSLLFAGVGPAVLTGLFASVVSLTMAWVTRTTEETVSESGISK